jgi:DMSO/TMAO reductase YedYZ molybdopterin-dependent catalytic subunit
MLDKFAARAAAAALAMMLIVPAASLADDVILRVGGKVETPLALTRSDLAGMPHEGFEIPTKDDKSVMERWEGVPMIEILRKAGAPVDDRLRGPNMAGYVVVTAGDGYRAVFALAEIDPAFSPERQILVADGLDGTSLSGKFGNLRIADRGATEFGRWVRDVVALEVRIAE